MTSASTERLDGKIFAQEGEKGKVWKVRPFQFVSLLDMIRFLPYAFIDSVWHLEVIEEDAYKHEDSFPSKLAEIDQKAYQAVINKMREHCEMLELDSALDQIKRIDSTIELGSNYGAYRAFAEESKQLLKCITTDLDKRLFFFVPPAETKYHEQKEPFGHEVAERFPEANEEIREAGNCYATGNNTACVFHLMRAVEHGARALVKRLKIKIGSGKDELPYPVELCDWGTIYTRLDEAVKKLPSRTSVKASERRAFYRHALTQFANFKDTWRNRISHTRVNYRDRPHLVMDAMDNTRHFMTHLVEGGLKEIK